MSYSEQEAALLRQLQWLETYLKAKIEQMKKLKQDYATPPNFAPSTDEAYYAGKRDAFMDILKALSNRHSHFTPLSK